MSEAAMSRRDLPEDDAMHELPRGGEPRRRRQPPSRRGCLVALAVLAAVAPDVASAATQAPPPHKPPPKAPAPEGAKPSATTTPMKPKRVAVSGPSLAAAFVEATKGLDKVYAISCVGPRLAADAEVLAHTFGTRVASTSCVARDDVVLVECRDARTDLSDANRLSANAVGAISVADVLVYVVAEHDARAPPNGKYLSGLVAGLERALATGRHARRVVVVAVAGPGVDDDLLATVDRQVKGAWQFAVGKPRGFVVDAETPRFVAARVADVDRVLGLMKSKGGGGDDDDALGPIVRSVLGDDDEDVVVPRKHTTDRRAQFLGEILASAEATAFPRFQKGLARSSSGPPTTVKILSKRQAIEVAAGARLSEACEALLADGGPVDASRDQLARQAFADDKFCETYREECEAAAADAIERLDDALDGLAAAPSVVAGGGGTAPVEWTETDAYARKRRLLREAVLDKLDDAFLDRQLQALAQQTAQRLRAGLKNLRISKSMTTQTDALLKEADAFFEAKASAAFGPTRPSWRAKKKQVKDALKDYVDERLQVARLQGTFLPDDQPASPLAKVWPFPITFAVHWLVPSALGQREQQSRGLTDRDKKAFNLIEGQTTRTPIPGAISKFTQNLVSSGSTSAPVE